MTNSANHDRLYHLRATLASWIHPDQPGAGDRAPSKAARNELQAKRLLTPWSRHRKQEFVVIGLGRFGSSVAHALVDYGYEVLAIDADRDRVQTLSTDLPNVVQLDATNAEGLRQIGVESFDTGLVSIGMNFESNLLATVLLLRFGVPRVITKARTSTQKAILERVGAHDVVLPEHEAGLRLARKLAHGHIVDYLEVSPDVNVVELLAPPSLWGQTLAEGNLRQNYGLTVIAIQREDRTVVSPPADFRLGEGDLLVVVGGTEEAERLRA